MKRLKNSIDNLVNMKRVKSDFYQLKSYISDNFLTYFGQSVFFFVSIFVLVFFNQIFLNLIFAEGTKVYSEIAESQVLVSLGPFIVKAILIVIAWIFVMTIIYTFFQGAIWCVLSGCTKIKGYLMKFGKQSFKWISILFMLLLIHLLISIVILSSTKASPYSVTSFSVLLSVLQLMIIVFVMHGMINNHAYFIVNKNADFKSAFRFAFKVTSLRSTFYYLIYISLLQIIGSFFMNSSLLLFIFVGTFLSLGTIAYYLMVLNINKNEI